MGQTGAMVNLNPGPVDRTARYSVARDPDEILPIVAGLVRERRGRVLERTESVITARLGSRVALRALGMLLPAEKWPIRIRTEVASEGGHVAVHISVSSDESPGLSRLASAQERYSRTVDRLLFELHERLSG
ncbi:MAG: hypothetical protein JWN05_75 [Arthrobacter sp.]|nr:hypothetical protein [Arthrobacter sp.]